MLNRRILRIKTFKTLFSYALTRDGENPVSLKEAERHLEESCEATRDLYIFLLAIVPELCAATRNRLDTLKGKLHPTEEEANPNYKFADNSIAAVIASDPDFRKAFQARKFSWSQYDILVRNICASMFTKDYYRNYLECGTSSPEEDCKVLCKVFEEEFVDNAEIESLMEDMNLWWYDDLAYALACCCDTFRSLAGGECWTMPPLYRSEILKSKGRDGITSDHDFMIKVFEKAYGGYGRYFDLIADAAKSWERDRLVSTDVCLMVCCLAEVEAFPQTAPVISVNEYVEISRFYSTPKSTAFVNGILNTLACNK